MWATRACVVQAERHVHSDAAGSRCRVYLIRRTKEDSESRGRLEGGQHAGQDFEPQILFVAQAVGASLDHTDLVVEPLDEAERDLVLQPAVGGDAVPMTIDHLGEFLVRLEPLPL